MSPDPPTAAELLTPNGQPIGVAGTQPSIREVIGDAVDAQQMFDDLTVGGVDSTPPGYPGKLVVLPSGGSVGFRPASKSGPPTLDVNVPKIPIRKVKFVGGTP